MRVLFSNEYINVFLQEEITEDDIDESFKSMFAQLAGEVRSSFLLVLTLFELSLHNNMIVVIVVLLWYFISYLQKTSCLE